MRLIAPALPVIVLSGLNFEAKIAAGDGVVSVCGIGSTALAKRLAHVAAQGCSGILSFGTAGGLAPMLMQGDCVLADTILDGVQRWPSDEAWLNALHALLPHARRGAIVGATRPVNSSDAKLSLWNASGALAVDMESHWAVRVARRYAVPFAACRVIVDPAPHSLPISATVGLRPNGRIAILPVLGALATHPGELAALFKLASDARVARDSLKRIRTCLGAQFAKPSGDKT